LFVVIELEMIRLKLARKISLFCCYGMVSKDSINRNSVSINT
jgi:hypothetical protein